MLGWLGVCNSKMIDDAVETLTGEHKTGAQHGEKKKGISLIPGLFKSLSQGRSKDSE